MTGIISVLWSVRTSAENVPPQIIPPKFILLRRKKPNAIFTRGVSKLKSPGEVSISFGMPLLYTQISIPSMMCCFVLCLTIFFFFFFFCAVDVFGQSNCIATCVVLCCNVLLCTTSNVMGFVAVCYSMPCCVALFCVFVCLAVCVIFFFCIFLCCATAVSCVLCCTVMCFHVLILLAYFLLCYVVLCCLACLWCIVLLCDMKWHVSCDMMCFCCGVLFVLSYDVIWCDIFCFASVWCHLRCVVMCYLCCFVCDCVLC